MPDADNLFDLFIAEAKEHVDHSEECLLRLGTSLQDTESLQACFRALHSLKGTAAFFELAAIQGLSHACEHVLDQIRTGERSATTAIVDTLLRAVSHLAGNISRLEREGPAASQDHPAALLDELGAIAAGPASQTEPPAGRSLQEEFTLESQELLARAEELLLAEGGVAPDQVREIFRCFHTLKGIAAYAGMAELETRAHSAEDQLTSNGHVARALDTPTRQELVIAIDELRHLLATAQSGEHSVPRLGDLLVREGIPRQEVETLAASLAPGQRLGEEVIARGLAPRESVERAVATQTAMRRTGDGFTRVATSKLEDLMNLVGELLIAQAMVGEATAGAAQEVRAVVGRQTRIVRDLQDLALGMRMVPLRGAFRKMARVVHDTAAKLGKDVDFRVEGEDTEIDRMLAEAITDPLMHMVRNAIDHGLENAANRVAMGKAPRGELVLRAAHSGDQVHISIQDDGRGLDAERIRAKAVERGLIAPDAQLAEDEAVRLIFLPGFSTAQQVSEISGRGVGLDVVSRNVRDLKGSIEVRSVPRRGTTFLIRLPLTSAILEAMLLRVGPERFLLPVASMVEALKPSPGDIRTVLGKGRMIESRGQLLPLIGLDRVFGIESKDSGGMAIVVDVLGGRLALGADDVLGQQQVVVKPLAAGVGHHAGIAGSAILGDGRVALLIDPSRLTHGARE